METSWSEIKSKVYYQDGSLRDIYVLNASKEDWEKWADYVNQRYSVHFYNEGDDISEDQVNFALVVELWEQKQGFQASATILVGNTQIKSHFFDEMEIENDIDPSEICSPEDHEKLLAYLKDISVLLGKEVIITPENAPDMILIKVAGDTVGYY